MKFYKVKTQIDGTTTGDFYGHAALLGGDTAFQAALANVNAKILSTAEVEIDIIPIDDSLPFGEVSVREVVAEYGSEAKMNERAEKKEKDAYNAPIYAKLAEIDAKSIRAMRAGDEEYIKKYEEMAKEERAKLK